MKAILEWLKARRIARLERKVRRHQQRARDAASVGFGREMNVAIAKAKMCQAKLDALRGIEPPAPRPIPPWHRDYKKGATQ